MTLTDPKTYTKPWVSEKKVLRLVPNRELPELFCVPSEEEAFNQRIRNPAGGDNLAIRPHGVNGFVSRNRTQRLVLARGRHYIQRKNDENGAGQEQGYKTLSHFNFVPTCPHLPQTP